jgi:hypothetical protein
MSNDNKIELGSSNIAKTLKASNVDESLKQFVGEKWELVLMSLGKEKILWEDSVRHSGLIEY